MSTQEKTKANAKRIKSDKQDKSEITQLQQDIEQLETERLELLQQLRLGVSSNVRKPIQLRRQIARLMTQRRQLELTAAIEGQSTIEDEGK